MALFRKALEILDGCGGKCDRSCYKCLRSYKNKFEHDLLDRYVAASLLRNLLDGELPTLAPIRMRKSTNKLFQDLQRRGIQDALIERDRVINIPGVGDVIARIWVKPSRGQEFIVALTSPLTPDFPADEKLREGAS